ncbi:MAG: hypothetical protein NWE78_07330 [Candidatus Bathyarchaeota archaeon]|nr:hypothetical protein [Candidatus Bathyarchaeota archaeon]
MSNNSRGALNFGFETLTFGTRRSKNAGKLEKLIKDIILRLRLSAERLSG